MGLELQEFQEFQLTEDSWIKVSSRLVNLKEKISKKIEEVHKKILPKQTGPIIRVKPLIQFSTIKILWPVCIGFEESFSAQQILDTIRSMKKGFASLANKEELKEFKINCKLHYELYLAPKNFSVFMEWCRNNKALLNHSLIKGRVKPIDDLRKMNGWSNDLEEKYSEEMNYWKGIKPLRSSTEWEQVKSDYLKLRDNTGPSKNPNIGKIKPKSALKNDGTIKFEFAENFFKSIKTFMGWKKYQEIEKNPKTIATHIEQEVIDYAVFMPALSARVIDKSDADKFSKQELELNIYFSTHKQSYELINVIKLYAEDLGRNPALLMDMIFELEQLPEKILAVERKEGKEEDDPSSDQAMQLEPAQLEITSDQPMLLEQTQSEPLSSASGVKLMNAAPKKSFIDTSDTTEVPIDHIEKMQDKLQIGIMQELISYGALVESTTFSVCYNAHKKLGAAAEPQKKQQKEKLGVIQSQTLTNQPQFPSLATSPSILMPMPKLPKQNLNSVEQDLKNVGVFDLPRPGKIV